MPLIDIRSRALLPMNCTRLVLKSVPGNIRWFRSGIRCLADGG
jgi:hypothetical protein